jgi:hypothetical protein
MIIIPNREERGLLQTKTVGAPGIGEIPFYQLPGGRERMTFGWISPVGSRSPRTFPPAGSAFHDRS